MLSKPCDITALIFSHSRKDMVMDALNSALNQKYQAGKVEIILVRSYHDEKIEEFTKSKGIVDLYEEEASLGKKICKGLKHANGSAVAMMDDDDYWTKDHLEMAAKHLSNEQVGYYHNTQTFVDEEKNTLPESVIFKAIKNSEKLGLFVFSKDSDKNRLSYLYNTFPDFNLSSMVFRTSLLKINMKLIAEFDTALDTLLFYLVLSSGKKMVLEPARTTFYRVHNRNVSTISLSDKSQHLKKIASFQLRRKNAYCTMQNHFAKIGDSIVSNIIRPLCSGLGIISLVLGNNGDRIKMAGFLWGYIRNSRMRLLLFRLDFLFYGLYYLLSPKLSIGRYAKRQFDEPRN